MRALAAEVRQRHGVGVRRACEVLRTPRSGYYYRSKRDPQDALRMRIKDIAAARVRYGVKRIYVLLRREGWQVNHKRVYRLYREEGLSLRLKRPKRHKTAQRREKCQGSGKARAARFGQSARFFQSASVA